MAGQYDRTRRPSSARLSRPTDPTPTPIDLHVFVPSEAQRWVHGWPAAVSFVDPAAEHVMASSLRPDLRELRLLPTDATGPSHSDTLTAHHVDAPQRVLESRRRRKVRPNGLIMLCAEQRLTPDARDGLFAVWLRWAGQQVRWYPVAISWVGAAMAGRLSFERCLQIVQTQTLCECGDYRGPLRS